MLRVLHCIYDDPGNPWVGGGGAARVRDMYRCLSDRLDVTVATGSWPGARPLELDGVRYIRIGEAEPYAWSRLTYARAATRLLAREPYDVGVIDFSAYAPVILPSERPVGVNVNHLTGPTARARWGALLGAAIGLEERMLLRRARVVSVISEWTHATLGGVVSPEARVMMVGCGVPDELFEAVRDEQDFILYFGRFDVFQKGLDVLLQAVARLVPAFPSLELRFVGRGRDPELREHARRLGIENNIRIVGPASDAERALLFSRARLMVMPSRFEGFGLVAAEAMAAGVPLVASSAGALPEVVDAPRGGVLVPPGDPAALADAIASLLRDPARRAGLTATARESARRFSWSVVAERHLRFLNAIIEDHQRRSHA